MDTITLGDHVLLKMPSGNSKVLKITAGENIKMGKFGEFNTNALVGLMYSTHYEISNGNIVHAKELDDLTAFDFELETDPDATNETVIDDPTAQSMTHEQIEELKGGQTIDHQVISI